MLTDDAVRKPQASQAVAQFSLALAAYRMEPLLPPKHYSVRNAD